MNNNRYENKMQEKDNSHVTMGRVNIALSYSPLTCVEVKRFYGTKNLALVIFKDNNGNSFSLTMENYDRFVVGNEYQFSARIMER